MAKCQLKDSFSAFPVSVKSETHEHKFYIGLMEKWFNKGKKHGMGLFYPLSVPPTHWLEPDFEGCTPAALLGWGAALRMEAQCSGWWSREQMVPDLWWMMPWNCNTCSEPHLSHSFYIKSHLGHCYFLSSLLPADALSNRHTLYHI